MDLFISYRRQEASRIAGMLYDSLTTEFGESSVYLDIDFIRPGVNFIKSISEAIGRSGIVLVLIGSRWLYDASGNSRIHESRDAVRYEIETALSRGVPVLPLLLEGATMPKRASLPISMAEIADLNALAVSLRSYDSDLRKLVAAVEPYVQNKFDSPDRVVSGMPFHGAGIPAPSADAGQSVVTVGEERSVLLERLLWTYNEHLDHAFDHGLGNLHPSLHWTAEAVARPRALIAEPTTDARESVPAIQSSSVLNLFDTTGGLLGDGLLILGGPGGGKTTALLQMSRGLAARSLQNRHHPIPVYLSLTSWPHRAKSITEWAADECWQMYNVPRELARRWIEDGSLIFVLDDLDQVSGTTSRSRCVAEINLFNRFARQRRVPMLVGSRIFEYELLPQRLQLEAAITIQPLDAQIVADYLSDIGLVGSADRETARRRFQLLRTLTSPLLVTMFVQTAAIDGGRGLNDPRPAEDAGVGQENRVDRAIISSYVHRRLELLQGEFEVRGLRRYKQEETLHWLSELARGLNHQMQVVLVLGRLGPSWLSRSRARVLAMVLPGMLLAATLGLITTGGSVSDRLVNSCFFALFGGSGPYCYEFLRGHSSRMAAASATGVSVVSAVLTAVAGAVVVSTIAGVGDGLDWALSGGLMAFLAILTTRHTEPAERLSWSWRAALKRAPVAIQRGIAVGLVSGCATLAVEALYSVSQDSAITLDLVLAATIAVSVGSLFGMATILFAGFVTRLLPMHKSPNEAIVRSLSNGIFIGLVSFFASFIVLGAFGSFVFGVSRGTALGAELSGVLGVVVGFAYGLNAAVQYLVIRFLLWRYGSAPLRFVRWLDYSVQLRILYRGGASGGYVFIHRSVQDYFAGRNG